MPANEGDKINPPPPPPPWSPNTTTTPIVRNLKTTADRFFRPPPQSASSPAPTGPYFFYGTLSSPVILRDVLNLEATPHLRPAKLTGYGYKLWDQYPALLDALNSSSTPISTSQSKPKSEVHGVVYHVKTTQHATRLAEYETSSYRAEPCWIICTDTEGNETVGKGEQGYTFKFVGNPNDLSEGSFDLANWQERMGKSVE